MSDAPRLCLVDDDDAARAALGRVLGAEGYDVRSFADGREGLRAALEEDFDCVLTDLRMPGLSGLDLVSALHEELPDLPVVLMTAHGTTEAAIEATRRGAFDYILKPFDMEELLPIVARAAEAGRRGRRRVPVGPPGEAPVAALVGNSRPMQAVYKEIGRIADKPVPVLILGETGTGKELVARALWQHGGRAARAFVAVNCAAIPSTLLESELFGHEKGAFTGADARRIGRFEQAHGGTLFLDEIGDLALETQAKLLRVLQEQSISRVGGRELIAVDVRVIAATHRDLASLVAAGRFREDLWYRLNVVALRLPPLRERREDVPELVRHFIARHGPELGGAAQIDAEAMRVLEAQTWPGNVRQLENVVKRALLLSHGYQISGDTVRAALSPDPVSGRPGEAAGLSLRALCAKALEDERRQPGAGASAAVLSAVERELLAQADALAGGNITRMGRLLGWSRLTVREKLRLYGLRGEGADASEA